MWKKEPMDWLTKLKKKSIDGITTFAEGIYPELYE